MTILKYFHGLDARMTNAIRFDSSHLNWLTRDGGSHGTFLVDAHLEFYSSYNGKLSSFVLGTAVAAGRMYASAGPLIKEPRYSFQIIAGEEEHAIMRRPEDPEQKGTPANSLNKNSHTFEYLNWHLSRSAAKSITVEALAGLPSPPPSMNVVMGSSCVGGWLRVETPLRHWSHRMDPIGWQIETGPMIWPIDLYAFAMDPSVFGLRTAWLHANRSDRVTISAYKLPCLELEARLSLLGIL